MESPRFIIIIIYLLRQVYLLRYILLYTVHILYRIGVYCIIYATDFHDYKMVEFIYKMNTR